MSAVAVGAACFALSAGAAGTASAQVALSAPAGQAKAADVSSKTIWVAVDYARLRSGPTTSRPNVIGSAMAGQGFSADCWTQENFHPTGGYIWYHGTPWGSGKTGYMRIDMFRSDHWTGGTLRRC
jgi:hypothetical protein